jgi:hypothetical protein
MRGNTVPLILESERWWQDAPLTGEERNMTLGNQTIPEEFFEQTFYTITRTLSIHDV